ncbi:ABC transporter ATP-binding protein [Mesorhizobium sp. B2-3-2]|nr:ABC transporter ATP-binding protein [Mesorhizobium sp. B2-3-2]
MTNDHRAERRRDGLEPEPGNQNAVDQADEGSDRAAHERADKRSARAVERIDGHQYVGQQDDAGDEQVEAAADDDKRLARGRERQRRRIVDEVGERVDRQRIGAPERIERMERRRDQYWHSLSGGERQRVHIARALAQTPTEILLDEPTNHLDIQHQIEVLRLISQLSLTSIITLHDLNHAAMFCDQLVVLDKGRIVACGAAGSVITEALLRDVFRVEARVETSPYHGGPHIHYLAETTPARSSTVIR